MWHAHTCVHTHVYTHTYARSTTGLTGAGLLIPRHSRCRSSALLPYAEGDGSKTLTQAQSGRGRPGADARPGWAEGLGPDVSGGDAAPQAGDLLAHSGLGEVPPRTVGGCSRCPHRRPEAQHSCQGAAHRNTSHAVEQTTEPPRPQGDGTSGIKVLLFL